MNGDFDLDYILSRRNRNIIVVNVSDQDLVDHSNDNGPTIFCKKFFNLNSVVADRIKGSLFPSLKLEYYDKYIKANPDLYGPIFVGVCLMFSLTICSNVHDYFTKSRVELKKWSNVYHAITKAFITVLIYSWILPVILWCLLKLHPSSEINISVLELICTYGYALAIYIPLSICWIFYIPYLQWSLLILGATSSGIVLVSTMKPAINKGNYTPVAAILVLHMLFSTFIFISFF